MKKISFLGDIMCELPFLKAAQSRGNDFYTAFSKLQPLLSESDFVVANLETPIAGEELGFTNDLYSFNTPPALLDALKKVKIDLFLTANNHCLDRGVKGLINTLDELEKRSMKHTGTFRSQEEKDNIFTYEADDTVCSFLSYNAYINDDKWMKHKKDLSSFNVNELIDMDLLKKYRDEKRAKSMPLYKFRKWLKSLIPSKVDVYIKKKMGVKFKSYTDNEPMSDIVGSYFSNVEEDIKKAKQVSDLVFVLPHCGGQFNITPGIRSKEIFKKLLECGSDVVVGSHPHTIQNISFFDNKPCVFSLGNASMSPSSPFIVKSSLPEYGLVFHAYIENKKIVKTSFSIIKTIEEADHYSMVFPVDELFKISSPKQQKSLTDDLSKIYGWITGNNSFPGINREYQLPF